MVYGPLQKLDTLGISFWFCNTAAWFLIYLCLTYKVQVKYWLRSDSLIGHWFRSANSANQINGNSLLSSTIHAVLTTCLAFYIVFIDEKATPNDPFDHSKKIKFVQSMSLGYFLSDFAVLVHTRELGGTNQLLFHHSSAVCAYLFGMHYNMLGWYSCFRLMAEFSTPFVNIRWILYAIGLKNTRRYKINGLLMTISFFICRIFSMPFYWYFVLTNYAQPQFKAVPLSLCIFWLLLPACLDFLNLFWFRKMLMGALKAMAAPDADDSSSAKSSETKIKKREKVKQYVQEKYVNFKSIIMRRKPAILRRRAE